MGMTTKKLGGAPKAVSEDTELIPETVESASPESEEAVRIEEEVSSEGSDVMLPT